MYRCGYLVTCVILHPTQAYLITESGHSATKRLLGKRGDCLTAGDHHGQRPIALLEAVDSRRKQASHATRWLPSSLGQHAQPGLTRSAVIAQPSSPGHPPPLEPFGFRHPNMHQEFYVSPPAPSPKTKSSHFMLHLFSSSPSHLRNTVLLTADGWGA